MLTKHQVYSYLCWYDPRHPEYEPLEQWEIDLGEQPTPPRENCSCDNCFYGRDLLAVEILKYIGE